MVALVKKYDWAKIQLFYNAGNSWNDIRNEFGVSSQAIAKAVKRGDLITRSLSEAQKLSVVKHGPRRMGESAKKRLSVIQSTNNRGGRCKWYEVSGQKVQGTWERNLAEKFNQVGIKWIKLSTGRDVWPYVINGKLHHYTPDFYLPDLNVFLEVKGYWWSSDKEKMTVVQQQHSNKTILIIEKTQYNQILDDDFSSLTAPSSATG